MKPFLSILTCVVYSLLFQPTVSAQQDELARQYWRIRTDLALDFMVESGNGPGGSCIGYRRVSPGDNQLKFGDNTAKLGIWISVLATEYAILKESGQPFGGSLKDLHQALSTINRLDLAAEPYFTDEEGLPGTPSLNGFYLRDDVGPLPAADILQLNTRGDIPPVTGVSSDYLKFQESRLGNMPSQDQMIYLMMGLAFVIKFVPAEAVLFTDGEARPFADGEIHIRREAMNILERLVTYMNPQDWEWLLYNPVTGNPIPPVDGGSALALSWGFHETWRHWTGQGNTFLPRALPWKRLFMGFRSEAVFRPVRDRGEGDKILTLAAISPAWGEDALPVLMERCMDPKGVFDFPHIPLVHCVLFERSFNTSDRDSLESYMWTLLSALPCYENPYNYGNHYDAFGRSSYGIREWSSNYRVIEPEGRGDTGPRHWNGYFSGFDWLFYHNLYRLTLANAGAFSHPPLHTGPYLNQEAASLEPGSSLLLYRDYRNEGACLVMSSGPSDTLRLMGLCPETPPSFVNTGGAVLRLKAPSSSSLHFVVGAGSRFILESGSILLIGEGVTLHIDPMASFIRQEGAVVRVEDGGQVTGNTGALGE